MLRLSELYTSIQGEGPRVGIPTTFVRFGGCNLRCPGWPCDTQYAIDPAYRKEWKKVAWEELAGRITAIGVRNVCLTGGEPFLQSNVDLGKLVQTLQDKGFQVEAFSNGTLLYPQWSLLQVRFTMDWKLPGSGEDPHNENRLTNIKRMGAYPQRLHAVKFVVKNSDDFAMAEELWRVHLKDYKQIEVFAGRVWDGDLTDAELSDLIIRHGLPWRLNVQMHNYIWDRNQREI
jgi:7-carboxy-7-deazaguanine synthase